MHKKNQLIEEFNQARDHVRGLLPQVDPHLEIYPGWTIKEVLAHLTGWDDATIFTLQAYAANEPVSMTAMRGIDYYNSQTVEERKELGYDQVVREWEWVRGQLIPIIDRLTDKELATTVVTPWGTIISIEGLIRIMIDHEKEHAGIIQERLRHPGHLMHDH